MDLLTLLDQKADEIVDESMESLTRFRLSNTEPGDEESYRERLMNVFELTRLSLKDRNLTSLNEFVEGLARQRYESGADLYDVQLTFNVLEETIWKRINADLSPDSLGNAVGMISTVLGAAKDQLARSYVSMTSKTRVPTLDLRELFKGSEGF